MQIWDKAANESLREFQAFTIFRDKLEARDFKILAQICRVSIQKIDKWRMKNNWDERVKSFNDFILSASQDAAAGDNELKKSLNLMNQILNEKIRTISNNPDSLKTDELIKLITSLIKIINDSEKSNVGVKKYSSNKITSKIAKNPEALKALYSLIGTLEEQT